jgi:hypothetical protein
MDVLDSAARRPPSRIGIGTGTGTGTEGEDPVRIATTSQVC